MKNKNPELTEAKAKVNVEAEVSHRERHKILHKYLDELVADMIMCTAKSPSKTTVMELMDWSYQQIDNPTLPTG